MSKNIAIVFPKDSAALFNKSATEIFGGASVQMYNFAKEIGKYSDFNTYSFLADPGKIDFPEKDHFKPLIFFSKKDSLPIKVFKFHKALAHHRIDIVIQHGLTPFSCLLALYCKLSGIRLVFMFAHDREANGIYQQSGKKCRIFRLLIAHACLLITQNRCQQEILKNTYRKPSVIVRNGFEIRKRPPDFFNCGKYILWVGRFDPVHKQPEIFLDLAHTLPHLKFVMICPGDPDNQIYQTFAEKTRKIKNLNYFRYVANDKIQKFFARAKIFVNTSKNEGFPQTFIEAGLNGVPIVSLNVDPDSFLTLWRCGYCCNGDVELLKKYIIQLSTQESQRKQYSKNIFQYSVNHHNIKENASLLIKLMIDPELSHS